MANSITDALAAAIPASALQPPDGTSMSASVSTRETSAPPAAAQKNKDDYEQQRKSDIADITKREDERDKFEKEGKPQFPDLAKSPDPVQSDDALKGYVSTIGILGAIGSMFTRRPMTNAMNAAAATLQAQKQGDETAFKQNYEKWKTENENALKLFDYQNATYKDILGAKNKSVDEKIGELKANAASFKDETMMQLLIDRNPSVIEEHIAKSEEAVGKARDHADKIQDGMDQRNTIREALTEFKKKNPNATPEQLLAETGRLANEAKGKTPTGQPLSDEDYEKNKNLPEVKEMVKDLHESGDPAKVTRGRSTNDPVYQTAMRLYAEKYPDKPLSQARLDYTSKTAAARAIGTKGAVVELSSNLLNNSLPILEDAFAKVDNSKFKDINSFNNFFKDHKNDPDLAALNEAIINTESDLALLMRRGGASTVDSAQRAEKIINNSLNSKSFASVKDQILKESKAATESVQETKDSISGNDSSAESPPMENAKKAPDGNWYVPDPDRPGKYLQVGG